MKLVTGCAGFIGSHLTEELLKKDYDVIGIDILNDYYSPEIKKRNLEELKKNNKFIFIKDDIKSIKLKKIFRYISTVFHLAAIAGVRPSIEYPTKYIDNNVRGTSNLLQYSLDNVKQFIFASSSSVYGNISLEELPSKEEDNLNPISPYGLSKLQGEELCNHFSKIYGLKTTILRFFTVYGPRQRPDEAIYKFIELLSKKETPVIYGNGNQTRDFTYINDIIEGIIKSKETKSTGTFNLGSGKRISVNNLIEIIEEEMKLNIKPVYTEKKRGDAEHTLANITKAKGIMGYEPKVDIKNGLKKFINWFKNRGGEVSWKD